MKILILGGTGAMGISLVKLLAEKKESVYVTSRVQRNSNYDNVKYIKGNAKDYSFLTELLKVRYDAIIDFMWYATDEFIQRKKLLLESTKQYFYFSSSRVYADSSAPITEQTNRLLDVCEDKVYLKTEEYALEKAKEENIIIKSENRNWTIIRPYITYNRNRLQLGVFEKENWLYRALHGRTIVISKDILSKKTSLTCGEDVAKIIADLIGKKEALGNIFHIVTGQTIKWEEVLELYLQVFEKRVGFRPKVNLLDDSNELQRIWGVYQIKYDRLYNRVFDSSKVDKVCGKQIYIDVKKGLDKSLNDFLDYPVFGEKNWRFEAWCDRICHERTKLSEIKSKKMKIKYLLWRYIGDYSKPAI